MAETPNTPATGIAALAIPESKPAAPAVTPAPQKAPADTGVQPTVPETPPPSIVTPDDFKRMTEEVNSTGDLSEESYKNLEAKGVPKDVAKSYVDARKAQVASEVNALYSEVGGKEQFQQIQKWAGEKLSDQQRSAFNNTLQSGDVGAITLALKGLKAAYIAEYGSNPSLTAGTANPGGPQAFESMREYIDAKKSPLYQRSPGYRATVESRFMSSKNLHG